MYGLELYGLVRRAVMLEGLSHRAAARRAEGLLARVERVQRQKQEGARGARGALGERQGG